MIHDLKGRGLAASSSDLKHPTRFIKQVDLARLVLGETRVELDHTLHSAIHGRADEDWVFDHVPSDVLVARRRGQRAAILPDGRALHMRLEVRKVERRRRGSGSRLRYLVDVGEDAAEKVDRCLHGRDLDHNADDSQALIWSSLMSVNHIPQRCLCFRACSIQS